MSTEQIIKLEQVSIEQKGHLVLTQINLTIAKGEFVYLIGKTGSGKSSLLKALYGELPVKGNCAEVAGYNLINLKRKEIPYLRRKLGIIFQDFQLLNDRNVRDNLLFIMKATGWKDKQEMNNRINAVLEKVRIGPKGTKMPFELSGGEQQRLAIARALINEPQIILADEPTGNLDPETSGEILYLLKEISNTGTAVLMASHDFGLMEKYPARTIRCEHGKIFL
jgi:cell division transport system ATP-binding protein